MINNERNYVLNRTRKSVAGSAAMIGYLFLVAVWLTSGYQTVNAQVDCSDVNCTSADQTTINGYDMFDETNFVSVVDGLGRTRQFYVHIPASYDTLPAEQLMPTIFAFHGGGQDRMAMIDGKWGDDYFNQEIAFVIPLGEPDPCDDTTTPRNSWIKPTWGPAAPDRLPDNCHPDTQVEDSLGNPVTYFSAAIPDTFTDVLFVENLRSIILSRFPKLNPNKVYATGFSSGGGLTSALLCYRSTLFRGFSLVAKTLFGEKQRGDYDADGIVETDPNSLIATCGKSQFDAGHATGIATPNLWGYGIAFMLPPPFSPLYLRNTKPITLFIGDQDDNTSAEINDTTSEIRARNNLSSGYYLVNPFMNSQSDEAETQRRIYSFASNPIQPSSTFTRYLVRKVDDPAITLMSAGHAIPDEDEPPTMTSDFNYTDRTVTFFESHADLNLNP